MIMNSLKKSMKSLFEQNNILDFKYSDFIKFELRVFLINNLKNTIGVNEGWSVFTRYFDVFNLEDEDEKIKEYIFKLKKNDDTFSKNSKWNQFKNQYLGIPEKLRIFKIHEDGSIEKIIAKYENDREKIYIDYLEKLDINKERELVYGDFEIEYRSKKLKDNIFTNKTYQADVIDMGYQKLKTFPFYKEKQFVTLSSEYSWNETLNEMGDEFKNRPNISLELINGESELRIENLIHIVGALGAGKSTYKYAQIFKAVRDDNLKIGVIEDSVSNVIHTVNVLRKLNINAVPIIGSSKENTHLLNYYSKLKGYDAEDDEILKYLSGGCIVKALANDNEDNFKYPCSMLRENDTSVCCNYASNCGHMGRYRDLLDTDVIVTTPHSLIKGSIPRVLDKYKRSIYELFHDLLDLIIVDEADGIQSIMDSQLMPNIKVNFGNDSAQIKFRELKSNLEQDRKNLSKIDHYKFSNNLNKLETILTIMNRILGKYNKIESFVMNKMLTPMELFKTISKILSREKTNENFIGFLESYVSFTDAFNIAEDTITHELNELYNKVSTIHITGNKYPEKEMKDNIEAILNRFNVIIPKNKRGKSIDKERFLEQLCLLVLLVQLDYILKILSTEYPNIKVNIDNERDVVDVFTQTNRTLTHLIKEPCIGTIYGYKISYNNGVTIEAIRYDGVGRALLEDWYCIKEDVGLKGPAVICLSGTSYSPGSAHYNIKKKPDVLLKGKEQGKINMKFLAIPKDGEYLRISGIQYKDERETNLKYIVKSIIRDIKYELKKFTNNKVLLVVNSYEDCRTVGEVLKNNGIESYIVQDKQDLENKIITKDSLEEFKDITNYGDICVVPLTIISRGYNILDDNNDSYFRSMFFLVRPYMIPGDFASYIQILHSYMDEISEEILRSDFNYSDRINNFRKRCYSAFSKIVDIGYWKKLNSREREILSWLMIVPIKQAIGRMQRNGTDSHVFFCDVAFCNAILEKQEPTAINSVINSWYEIISKYKYDSVISELYGEFFKALEILLEDINEEYFKEDQWEEE